jgi:TPR repeat protein
VNGSSDQPSSTTDTRLIQSIPQSFSRDESGDTDGNEWYIRGLSLRRDKKTRAHLSQAAHLFNLAADRGHALAQIEFATLLASGDGITKNKSIAAHYFKLAAN